MEKNFVFCIVLMLWSLPCWAAVNCMTKSECTKKILSGCCCKTGETGTSTSSKCPSGWILKSGICSRTSISGTNAAGAYTTTYGTCEPTVTTGVPYDCYALYLSNNGNSCMCTSTPTVQ